MSPWVFVNQKGVENVHTSVVVPTRLHNFARREGVSLSGTLRTALEVKYRECERGPATNEDLSRPTPTQPCSGDEPE